MQRDIAEAMRRVHHGAGKGNETMDWNATRPGEMEGGMPDRADAAITFIGRIRTPFATRAECPHRGSPEGPVCRIEIEAPWRPALRGIEPGARLEVLYWMHLARRDLLVQAPKGRPPLGTLRCAHRTGPTRSVPDGGGGRDGRGGAGARPRLRGWNAAGGHQGGVALTAGALCNPNIARTSADGHAMLCWCPGASGKDPDDDDGEDSHHAMPNGALLTPEQYRVMRLAPNPKLRPLMEKRAGVHLRAVRRRCSARRKRERHVAELDDLLPGAVRPMDRSYDGARHALRELRSHLGHVFDDGPPPSAAVLHHRCDEFSAGGGVD